MLIMARRRKSSSASVMPKGIKTQANGRSAVLIAASAAMLIGMAIVVYGYLSYRNPTIWIGILAVILGLWWIALRSSGRSPFAVRS